jgi:hypothetical protein
VAELDPPAVAEGAPELGAGPLQEGGGLDLVAGDQGRLGQGVLGMEPGVGGHGGRAEQVDGVVGQLPGPARLAKLAPEPGPDRGRPGVVEAVLDLGQHPFQQGQAVERGPQVAEVGVGQRGPEAGGEQGPEQPGGPAGVDALVQHPGGLGEPVAVVEEQAQPGQAGGPGGVVGLAGLAGPAAEDGVEGRPGPGQVAVGMAHAGGQQQRRRPGPAGRHRALGQLPGFRRHL